MAWATARHRADRGQPAQTAVASARLSASAAPTGKNISGSGWPAHRGRGSAAAIPGRSSPSSARNTLLEARTGSLFGSAVRPYSVDRAVRWACWVVAMKASFRFSRPDPVGPGLRLAGMAADEAELAAGRAPRGAVAGLDRLAVSALGLRPA
ncbi:hypothetical protein BN12_580010 [Nostocoides japonicum T1-X7]|uniref:Uncharacterized protein n=1 Tax=Nostocoides japonicum T1-X7 TaxID=1194083 RepID=A0A077M1Q9_9MICO|nr:hypothetical protein BN12_580010 [Tetrasphaera japonica T1-X7]